MKIFRHQPKMTLKDKKRLSPMLSNYNKLVEHLASGDFSQEDLKRLVLLEVKGKKREHVLNRLVARVQTKERERIHSNIEKCVNQN